MKNYVEFYFPGICCAGKCEREVSSRNVEEIPKIPEHAISFRFFSKDANENKVDYSPYYFLGKEYSPEELKKKYPQLDISEDFSNAKRIVRTITGSFYLLKDEDIVVAV